MGVLARLEGTWKASSERMRYEQPTFEEFFEAEKDRLLRILCVITGSRSEAEDIAQEAFTRLLERWDAVAVMQDPGGYLYRTAMNVFRSQYRRAATALKRAVALRPDRDVFQAVEDRDVVVRALASLTPRQRAALVLTEALGYSGEEAGRLLGIRASTVWALTHQARTVLNGPKGATDD